MWARFVVDLLTSSWTTAWCADLQSALGPRASARQLVVLRSRWLRLSKPGLNQAETYQLAGYPSSQEGSMTYGNRGS